MLESLANNTFTYKKLTEEEQNKRGILGRLAGVIADSKNPTRNGRQYSASLWEHVFDDPIMQEKIENRCCFGELGHPADREEVDPEKIAICLAEKPKMGNDGKLYGVFDILNTPCGKILKALCDYGAKIGVSSRGSGDIMGNDEVDPETYYFECFDAVLVPAVKSARLQYVTESLDPKAVKLRKALTEAYKTASSEDKKIMKEKLDDLNIDIEDSKDLKEDLPLDEIPMAEHEENFMLVEDKKEDSDAEDDVEVKVDDDDSADEDSEDEVQTVGELIKSLKDFDKKLEVEFSPIVIGDNSYEVNGLELDDSQEGKLLINIGCDSEMSDDIEDEVDIEQDVEANAEDVADEEISDGVDEESEEAIDNGEEEVIESLKEMVRQRDALEKEVKNLKGSKTVRDAEVKKLKEELDRYKTAYARTSEIAAGATKAKAEVQKLTEALNNKNKRIKELESVKANTNALTESVNTNKDKVVKLTEALNAKQKELDTKERQLTEQRAAVSKQLNEQVELTKKYKAKLTEAVNKYIESKAEMLGVRTSEITNRLNDKFSMNDIDVVCENLLKESVNFNRLPFNSKTAKMKINEAKDVKPNAAKAFEDECYADLLTLAGLDK